MTATPEKHTTYFETLEALKQTAECAICGLAGRAVWRYLDTVLYENVNDPGMRARLQASGGFCARHALALLTFGDGLGTSLLYRDQVQAAIDWLEEAATPLPHPHWRRQMKRAIDTQCPACEREDEAARRYAETLWQFMDDPELQSALVAGPGLCLPHLRLAVMLCRENGRRKQLLTLHRDKYRRLLEDLNECVRKHDYRFADEPPGRERDAWQRAVHTLHGCPLAR